MDHQNYSNCDGRCSYCSYGCEAYNPCGQNWPQEEDTTENIEQE